MAAAGQNSKVLCLTRPVRAEMACRWMKRAALTGHSLRLLIRS